MTTLDRASVAGRRARQAHARTSARTIGVRLLWGAALAYVHLWILEGAVRKWLPSLDSVMYVARDGLIVAAILIGVFVVGARAANRSFTVVFWMSVLLLVIYSAVQAILFDMSTVVLLIGVRSYLAPLLLIYVVVSQRFTDFPQAVARIVLWYAPVQAIIIVIQVLSPKNSPINVQTGGDDAYFTTADGIVRASGLFSAPAGLILFLGLVTALSFATLAGDLGVSRALGWLGLVSCLVTVVLCGSRGAVLIVLVLVGAWALQSISLLQFRRLGQAVLVAVVGVAGFLSVYALAPQVVDAFATRFTTAASQENSLVRLLATASGFTEGVTMLGDGVGSHSAAGIAAGSRFEWVEGDSARWVAELGLIGLVLALARVVTAIALLVWLVVRIRRLAVGQLMTGVLICQLALFGAITTQPSSQGYFAIVIAVFLALTFRWQWDVKTDVLRARSLKALY